MSSGRGLFIASICSWFVVGCGGADDVDGSAANRSVGTIDSDAPLIELKIDAAFDGLPIGSAPPGSTCTWLDHNHYVLDWNARRLASTVCVVPEWRSGELWKLQTSERTLSTSDFALIGEMLANVRSSSAMTCGGDGGIVLLDKVSSQGVQLYVDDFYSGCPQKVHEGRIIASGLRELANALYSRSIGATP